MFEEVLTSPRIELLKDLGTLSHLNNYYMAGGTAAALQMGHRRSVDFDFFGSNLETENLTRALDKEFGFQVSTSEPGALHGMVKDTKVSFLQYHYPLIFPTHSFISVELADIKDIALMKIVAIANRGTKKDFTDLYFICEKAIGLEELLIDLFPKKYGQKAYSTYHIIRSLQYFDDAEAEPPLDMFVPLDWTALKKFFTGEVTKIANNHFQDYMK